MEIYVMKDNAQTGPFSIQDIKKMITSGNAYLGHETAVKSMGFLHYIAGGLLAMAAGACILLAAVTSPPMFGSAPPLFYAAVFSALAVFYFWLGRAMRRLDSGAVTPSIIMACIGLLGFPLGTLINGYFLYLLLSDQGKMVFSEEYSEVIEATPDVKHKTGGAIWFLVIFVLILTALVIAGVIFGPPGY